MYLKDKFFTQLLCNFFQIIPTAFCLWNKLTPEDIKVPKLLGEADVPPVIKYRNPGPFESLYDYLQNPNPDDEGVGANNSEIKEKIFEMRKEKTGLENKILRLIPTNVSHNESNPAITPDSFEKMESMLENQYPRTSELFGDEISTLKGQIKMLRKIARFMQNMNRNFENLKKDLSPEMRNWVETIFEEPKENDNNTRKEDRMMFEGTGFKGMNNVTYNNQYQIGAIFIINRLSEEKEDGNSKLNRYKGAEGKIFNELTDREMKELLLQTLNNLSSNTFSQPKEETPSINHSEINLLKELQSNFSKMFRNHNVTLKEMNQMSKIIDFVERYHGTVGRPPSPYDRRRAKTYNRMMRGRNNWRRMGAKGGRGMKKRVRIIFGCGRRVTVTRDTSRRRFPLLRRKRLMRRRKM